MNRQHYAGLGMIALGVGIASSAVLGPLVLGIIRFRTSVNIENQFVGSEIVSLGIVAPVAMASGVLWWRGSRLGPALALAPTLYSIYTYSSAILGQEYTRYDGNVERFFPLYAALVAGSTLLAGNAWGAVPKMPEISSRLRLGLASLLLAGGLLIGLAWIGQIRLVYKGRPPQEYLEDPTVFWVIKLFDLGFVIPAALFVGIGLLQRNATAMQLAIGLSGFFTCMAGAVAGMATVMVIRGDASGQPVVIAVLIPFTGILAGLTWSLLKAIGVHDETTPVHPSPAGSTGIPGRTPVLRSAPHP